jgi:hypothetical protein
MSTTIKLIISSPNGDYFNLSPQEAIQLELKLNVTKHGHTWKDIGDVLFNFNSSNTSQNLTVTPKQFEFFQMLNTKKSWEECKNLE